MVLSTSSPGGIEFANWYQNRFSTSGMFHMTVPLLVWMASISEIGLEGNYGHDFSRNRSASPKLDPVLTCLWMFNYKTYLVGIRKSAFLVMRYAVWYLFDPSILLTPGRDISPSNPNLDIKSKPARRRKFIKQLGNAKTKKDWSVTKCERTTVPEALPIKTDGTLWRQSSTLAPSVPRADIPRSNITQFATCHSISIINDKTRTLIRLWNMKIGYAPHLVCLEDELGGIFFYYFAGKWACGIEGDTIKPVPRTDRPIYNPEAIVPLSQNT